MKTQFIIFTILLAFACQKDSEDASTLYEAGRTDVYLTVENEQRHFVLYIPESYDPKSSTSVVFMLHGSSGDGNKFYRISGWTEVSDSTGIITVFPSSGEYCIEEDGRTKNTTKWNTYKSDWDFCASNLGMDDVAFFRGIVDHLDESLNIDKDSVYLAGFSNGGIMAAQSAVELGDIFAAIAANAGTFPQGGAYEAFSPIPYMVQIGNEEDHLRSLNLGNAFPLNRIEELMTLPQTRHVFEIPISIFNLSDQHTLSGQINQQACLTFPSNDLSSGIEFRFCLINKLEHNYPNGRNHPFLAAWDQWKWMQRFSK